jgi:D-arabinonate dehydratase
MEVGRAWVHTVAIPLAEPVAVATRVNIVRTYTIVRLLTGDGIEGTAYAFGDDALSAATLELAEEIVAKPLSEWEAMRDGIVGDGDGGALTLRACALLELAVYDLRARIEGVPLYELLGGARRELPVYVNGGYYRDGWGVSELAQETERYVAQGFGAMKMRIARVSPKEDEERIRAVSACLGPDRTLIIDANAKWQSISEALPLLNRIADVPIGWLEDPFPETDIESHRLLREQTGITIGTGEALGGDEQFGALLAQNALQVVQPDVTIVGGIVAWLRIARLAEAYELPVVPHFFPELHIHLAMAAPNVALIECVAGDDIVNQSRLMQEPLRAKHGLMAPPSRPGLGLAWDEDVLTRYGRKEAVPR